MAVASLSEAAFRLERDADLILFSEGNPDHLDAQRVMRFLRQEPSSGRSPAWNLLKATP